MALCVSLDVNASASLSRADATDAGSGITARSNATAAVQYLYTTRSRWRVGGWRVKHGATQWRIDWCSWSMRCFDTVTQLVNCDDVEKKTYAMKLDSQMVKFAVMMPAVFLRPKVKERGDRTFPNCNSSRQRWKDFLQDNTVIFSQPPWLVPSWPFVGPSLVPDAAPMIPTLHGILTGTVFGNITEQWRVLWDSGFIAA